MTPLGGSQGSSLTSHHNSLFGFDLPPSSHSAGSYRLPFDFGKMSPWPKINMDLDPVGEINPLYQDEMGPVEDLGIEFDEEGNLIERFHEHELPPLPGTEAHAIQLDQDIVMTGAIPVQDENPFGGDAMLIMGEDALPDAEPFPKPQTKKRPSPFSAQDSESAESQAAAAPAKRGRRPKISTMLDRHDRISTAEFRTWENNYVENMDSSRKKPRTTTAGQARKNAITFLFGNGICGVGITSHFSGFPHPLAEDFAGTSLKARLQG